MPEERDWAFVYKCRICGGLEHNPYFFARRHEASSKIVEININGRHVCPVHRSAVYPTSIHFCEDGSIGISDLQGVVPKELN